MSHETREKQDRAGEGYVSGSTTTERYHVVSVPVTVRAATIACYSGCGPVLVSTRADDQAPSVLQFRPDSPVYQVLNRSVTAHVILPLEIDADRAMAAVSFTNNSAASGQVGVIVLLDLAPTDTPAQQERVHYRDDLAAGSGVTVQVVFVRR